MRFLPQAKAALVLKEGGVDLVRLREGDVQPVESLFAYPYGRLSMGALARAKSLAIRPDGIPEALSRSACDMLPVP